MPNYTPELEASVVHDYVHTDKSTRQIAADHRINERDVTRIRHAHGIPTRRSRARELPPEMHEAREITRRLKAEVADVGRNTRREAERIAPDGAGGAMRGVYHRAGQGPDPLAYCATMLRLWGALPGQWRTGGACAIHTRGPTRWSSLFSR
jgi:hypothetical protein